jgi:hypothetical protein
MAPQPVSHPFIGPVLEDFATVGRDMSAPVTDERLDSFADHRWTIGMEHGRPPCAAQVARIDAIRKREKRPLQRGTKAREELCPGSISWLSQSCGNDVFGCQGREKVGTGGAVDPINADG